MRRKHINIVGEIHADTTHLIRLQQLVTGELDNHFQCVVALEANGNELKLQDIVNTVPPQRTRIARVRAFLENNPNQDQDNLDLLNELINIRNTADLTDNARQFYIQQLFTNDDIDLAVQRYADRVIPLEEGNFVHDYIAFLSEILRHQFNNHPLNLDLLRVIPIDLMQDEALLLDPIRDENMLNNIVQLLQQYQNIVIFYSCGVAHISDGQQNNNRLGDLLFERVNNNEDEELIIYNLYSPDANGSNDVQNHINFFIANHNAINVFVVNQAQQIIPFLPQEPPQQPVNQNNDHQLAGQIIEPNEDQNPDQL